MKVIAYYPYRKARVIPPVHAWPSSDWQADVGFRGELGDCYKPLAGLDRCKVARRLVRPLERALLDLYWIQTHGQIDDFAILDNHVCYVYVDDSGVERAVWFHDSSAYFGLPEDLHLTHEYR